MDEFTQACEETIRRSKEFHSLLCKEFLLDKFVVPSWWYSDARPAISFAFINLGLLHLGGVIMLAEAENYTSCLALLRPMVEASVRGLWLFYCAADEKILSFAESRERFEFPRFRLMLEEIASQKADISKRLLRIETWKDLCDYTHGGVRLIERFAITEANSDKARLQIMEAVRNGTTALGISVFLFVQDRRFRPDLKQFTKTLLLHYVNDGSSYKRSLQKLKSQLEDEELRYEFEAEVEKYKLKGDRRYKESYKENPFDD